jgi:CBS domain-containing protein
MVSESLTRYARAVVTARLDESVADAARLMRDRKVGSVVVTREGRAVGVLTDRDLALRVVAEARDPERTTIEQVVTYDPVTLKESDTIETAVLLMRDRGVRRLPIVDALGAVLGIVTADDLIVRLSGQLAALGEAIEEPADADDSR